jgi:hypothetical protein
MFLVIKKVCHLPLDVMLLSIDFVSLTRWRLAGYLASSLGVLGPRTGPFCTKRFRAVDTEGKPALCAVMPTVTGIPLSSPCFVRGFAWWPWTGWAVPAPAAVGGVSTTHCSGTLVLRPFLERSGWDWPSAYTCFSFSFPYSGRCCWRCR